MSNSSILVVEDDDTIRKLLVTFLGQRAHTRVDSARDGVEALHQIAIHRYRVIVLDVVMPKMSGVDFLNSLEAMMDDHTIRSFDEPPAVFVITATPPSELPQNTLQGRYPKLVRDVFRKPIDLPELARSVEAYLTDGAPSQSRS
ncbi:MAG TPA: response regulator [Thermoanaerobaculia bacterium]|nr:response regulator [Thermoanaerobaculia bacterium]